MGHGVPWCMLRTLPLKDFCVRQTPLAFPSLRRASVPTLPAYANLSSPLPKAFQSWVPTCDPANQSDPRTITPSQLANVVVISFKNGFHRFFSFGWDDWSSQVSSINGRPQAAKVVQLSGQLEQRRRYSVIEHSIEVVLLTISLRKQQFISSQEEWGQLAILGSLHLNETFLTILLKRADVVASVGSKRFRNLLHRVQQIHPTHRP